MKGKDGLLLCFHHVLREEKDVQLLEQEVLWVCRQTSKGDGINVLPCIPAGECQKWKRMVLVHCYKQPTANWD